MLLDDIEIVMKPEIKLVGYQAQASLNEDIQGSIVRNLRAKLELNAPHVPNMKHAGMYLIQIYPDIEWTPDVVFTHIVAIEVQESQQIADEIITHTVPAGRFIRFIHEGSEAEIDDTYLAVNEWLANNGYDEPRAFDMELWTEEMMSGEMGAQIHIYVPIT
ncbi:GyrI-like domain-containing protein [Paenibacillus sp. ACRSA]|uniref:GyrI-like domain-containing protein n=1 Tax=Paenibacillus sp. ACRSA TaxID=2918211 RepID=UPI001EF513CB|nr:GyrI-like domain-containing protein [Paenibacillus sp. ACRSA]MCG7377286.1 GyrI-like domain-containing protein [Paenibacillus sp. ACRSA]